MWEEIKILIAKFFETYPNRKFGFIGGVFIGAVIWFFGFFPTLFALSRARKYLDSMGSSMDLVITGGLRVSPDCRRNFATGNLNGRS